MVLDDTKDGFDPGSDAVALAVKRAVGTGSFSMAGGLAMDPPLEALGLGGLRPLGIRLCFVAIEDLFAAMQTVGHDLRIMDGGRGHYHAMYPSMRITANMFFEAEMPRCPLLLRRYL